MANKLYEESDIKAIAVAIRARNGKTSEEETYTIADMSIKVYQLPSLVVYQHPEIEYSEEKASEIAAVAQTYLDAVNNGVLIIVYEAGYSALDGVIKNDAGQYIIQCSALAGLILRGIPYEESPYYNGDTSRISARTDLYSWANSYYEKTDIKSASALAQYAMQTGCMLNSQSVNAIKKADILFFAKGNTKYFANIWHVAIALADGGTNCIHALSGQSSGIWTFDMASPPSILGDLAYIARPQYNLDFASLEENAVLKILEQPTDQSGAAGETAVFTVKAQGVGLTYQWYYRTGSTSDWYQSTFAGYDTDTQPVEIQSWRDGHQYRCVITDAYGNTVTSDYGTIIMAS